MLLAGSDDGVYRLTGVRDDDVDAEKALDAGQVMRVRRFESLDGVFAATETGLYHSRDGSEWSSLGVPREKVYAVTVSPDGDRVYAGTRPAHLYVSESVGALADGDALDWRELDGFQDLPSRDEWRLPRHDDLAQVRSLWTHPDAPDRVVAGVEVGGVHVSDDRGETWTERRIEGFDAPHTDDVHHLLLAGPDTFVASTGSGVYRSTDAGRSWTRLDEGHPQWYFRESFVHDGVVFSGAAHGPTSTWEEEDDYALFESSDGETVEAVDYPVPDEVPAGWCAVDGAVLCVTHAGTLLSNAGGEWHRIGEVPTPGDVGGRYLPLAWVED